MNSQVKPTQSQMGESISNISLDNRMHEHDQALIAHKSLVAEHTSDIVAQELSPELQHVVQILCETYEALDLRIETTLGAAEADFMSAMPEVAGYETDLRQLVALLMTDFRESVDAKLSQPVMLRFAYQDKGDLVEQLISGSKARLVVVNAEDDVSIHANIRGFTK